MNQTSGLAIMDLRVRTAYSTALRSVVCWMFSNRPLFPKSPRLTALFGSVLLAWTLPAAICAQTDGSPDIEVVEVVQSRTPVVRFGSNASSRLNLAEQVHNPGSLTDMVDRAPGVAKSGQNGLFQVFSIRGTAGQRVQTRFSGIPIIAERRAGSAASFIDPFFLEYVDVVRGPASTFFGSGAIGGVVLTEPVFYNGAQADLSWEAGDTQKSQSFGAGSPHWSLGLSNRSGADGQTPDGEPLHTGFRQSSLLLQSRWSPASVQIKTLLLSSRGRDIGRSNNLFPASQIASIAEDTHDLLQLSLAANDRWQARFYVHDQFTRADTLRLGQRENIVDNSSLDWGGHFSVRQQYPQVAVQIGVDADLRDRVNVQESERAVGSSLSSTQSNLAADQQSYGLFATATLNRRDHSFQLGLRQDWTSQQAETQAQRAVDNLTGYLEWQWFFTGSWSLSAELATAYRVPTLTELYFTGTTGRGSTVGNPLLLQETAPGADLGLHWDGGQHSFSAHLFQQRFSNYIDRTVISREVRGYGNLQDGSIRGVELESRFSLAPGWSGSLSGHWIEGKASDAKRLSDIPAAAVNLGAHYEADRWQLGLHWWHRLARRDVSAVELPVDSANVLDADFRYRLADRTHLTLYLRNGLNDHYRISADEISTPGNRHALGIRLSHHFP